MRALNRIAGIGGGRRAWIGGLSVGALLGFGIMATLTFAHAASGDSGKISACVETGGQLRIAGKDGSCKVGETPLGWNIQGPQGPQGDPGVFNGTFRSPSGQFSLQVTDTGIVLSGPGGSVRVGTGDITVSGTGRVSVTSAGQTSVQGSMVLLNGGCSPVVRSTDQTAAGYTAGGPPYAPQFIPPLSIGPGSPTVLSC